MPCPCPMKPSLPIKWILAGGLCLAAAAATFLLVSTGRPGSGEEALTRSIAGKSRLAEAAMLTMAQGVDLKDSGSGSLKALLALARSPEEERLIRLLATGKEADAIAAITGLAALGGNANRILAAIMRDAGWPDTVRTQAALALVEGGSEREARSGIQALAVIGGEANTARLASILQDDKWPQNLRLQAALDLGHIGTPQARDILIGAFEQFDDPDIQSQLLDSLGRFPFPQIEETWKEFLSSPDTPDELRVAAADALSNSTEESLPFLMSLASSDRDPEVREMAAWAISVAGMDGPLGPELRDLALTEPDTDVRRRLYEAIMRQAENPAQTLLPQIREESDIAARIAGLNAVASSLGPESPPEVTGEFDSRFVPELTKVALSDTSLNLRMRSVFALRRAGTPAARQALSTIAQTPNPEVAQAASNGL